MLGIICNNLPKIGIPITYRQFFVAMRR